MLGFGALEVVAGAAEVVTLAAAPCNLACRAALILARAPPSTSLTFSAGAAALAAGATLGAGVVDGEVRDVGERGPR